MIKTFILQIKVILGKCQVSFFYGWLDWADFLIPYFMVVLLFNFRHSQFY